MAFDYAEAASLAFKSDSFTIREFAGRTGSLRAARTLSELKLRGLVERVGRGRYRMLAPAERPDRRAEEWARVRSILLEAELQMAWTGPSAVSLWTGFRYTVSPSVFVREFHIAIPRTQMSGWEDYLRKHRVSTDRRSRIGAKVVLLPSNRLRRVFHRGEPVLSRNATLALIRAHRGIYANADQLVERGP